MTESFQIIRKLVPIITAGIILISAGAGSAFAAEGTDSETWIELGSSWSWWKGLSHPASGNNSWTSPQFNDDSWDTGEAPFYYGEPLTGGTVISDMRSNYTSIFLRRKFMAHSVEKLLNARVSGTLDDGMIVWLNGSEIGRVNMPAGDVAFDSLASSATEPTSFEIEISQPERLLIQGENILAVQVFNGSRTSSDLVFELEFSAELPDQIPPVVIDITPNAGVIDVLNYIQVTFSEPVLGVDASDLSINGESPIGVTASGGGTVYIFEINPIRSGQVQVEWLEDHEITDVGGIPFTAEGDQAFWVYQVVDQQAPEVDQLSPAPGHLISSLEFIDIWMNEPVTGVRAEDFKVNGLSAISVTGADVGPYRFALPPLETGEVRVIWEGSGSVADLADPANFFAGAEWTFFLNPGLAEAQVIISELVAVNQSGILDKDRNFSDWVEIWNRGDVEVDLSGWSISDDLDAPGKWIFPNGQSLAVGERRVFFANGSELDPRLQDPVNALNFQLSSEGEYLGLFDNAAPRNPVFELRPGYPEQRADIAYGIANDGGWGYLRTPTPGTDNSRVSQIVGVLTPVDFSHSSGFYEDPFELSLSVDAVDAEIYYTLDGTLPSSGNGNLYTGPILIQAGGGAGGVVLRAIATKADYLDSRVRQATWFFPEAILTQTRSPRGWPSVWGPVSADYEMDPTVAQSERYKERALQALTSIPTLSLAVDLDDLFDNNRGIYANPQSKGAQWEKPVHAEFLYPGAPDRPGGLVDRFEILAGLKLQGGSSRIPAKAPKHSFRLQFKSDYGPGKLRHRIFPESPVGEFDTLVLDAGLNLVFIHPDHGQRVKSQYVRDQFVSDIHTRMGYPAFHGRFFNLYINGIYWGLFGVHERTDDAFAASYLGGEKEEWDVLKNTTSFAAVSGDFRAWNEMMGLVRQNLSDKANFDALSRILDITGFIDYMILNFWFGNTDWPHHNWYAARKKESEAKFQFFSWDAEHVMKSLQQNSTGEDDANTPGEIYQKLMNDSAEFRLMFADRVQRWFFRDGPFAMDPDRGVPNMMELYERRLAEVDLAVILESARWGDLRPNNARPGQPYERDVEWWNEWLWLRDTYFPQRSAVVLNQFRSRGLYPGLSAPELDWTGELWVPGSALSLEVDEIGAEIYYTLDGTDPRMPFRDRLHPSAQLYDRAQPPVLEQTSLLKARTFRDGEWSALLEVILQMDPTESPIQFTEIHYHPLEGELFEFVEIRNSAAYPVDLSGWTLDGVDLILPTGTILYPGQVGVIASAENPVAFSERYPAVQPLAWFEGRLSNGGERLQWRDHLGHAQGVGLTYADSGSWPNAADGTGPSLEWVSGSATNNSPDAWRVSSVSGGTPGLFAEAEVSAVKLNEVLAWNTKNLDGTSISPDWLELVNRSDNAMDLGGWLIVGRMGEIGNPEDSQIWRIPNGVKIEPGEYLVIYGEEAQGASDGEMILNFSLNREGETLRLFNAEGLQVDSISFGPQLQNFSIGRTDELDGWHLNQPTPGSENVIAETSRIWAAKLNELLADSPPDSEDWIELYAEPGVEDPIELGDWRIQVNGVWGRFPQLSFIQSGSWVRFWMDDRSYESHLDFRLPAEGAELILLDPDFNVVDELDYTQQAEGISWGRSPDGAITFQEFTAPTPGASNVFQPEILAIRWNDASNEIELEFQKESGSIFRIEALPAGIGQWVVVEELGSEVNGLIVWKWAPELTESVLWIRIRVEGIDE